MSDALDPKGLIREALSMDLSPAECRSILLDWALSVPAYDLRSATAALLERHGPSDHPMAALLAEAAAPPPERRRRGGWAARPRPLTGGGGGAKGSA